MLIEYLNEIDDDLLKLIIEQLNSIAITDNKGRYIYVNQSWSDLMGGITLEEISGKYVRDLIPNSRIDEALMTKQPIIGHCIKSVGKNPQEVFSSYFPIQKDGKVIAGFIFVIISGLTSAIDFAKNVNTMTKQIKYYQKELKKLRGARYSINNIIGESDQIKELKANIYKAARSFSTVLIEGETGSGKELVAHSIHDLSVRSEKPLVKVNCAAIPSDLLESEFFGYDEGAFTGAKKGGKLGKFELAQEGTLFLDEINQLSYALQPKILRALQEKEIERVGGKGSVSLDVRLVVASNRSLEKMVKNQDFRSDLFYRLNVIKIKIPPLREHKDDIGLIAENLIDKLNYQLGMSVIGISDKAIEKLKEYDWPGNVRELQNCIERAMNNSWGEMLKWEHFEAYFQGKQLYTYHVDSQVELSHIKDIKNSVEKETIIKALELHNNNKTSAAKALGISRTLIYKKIAKYDL